MSDDQTSTHEQGDNRRSTLASPPIRRPNLRSVKSSLSGTGGLATNGGSLIVNVIVAGLGGFVFWIVAANHASTEAVARASAMVSAMLGLLTLSQWAFTANLPPLIAASPEPRRLAARAYMGATTLTGIAAGIYIIAGPRVSGGLDYLRDGQLAVIFFLGCITWSTFSLQDALLSGLRKGHLVLVENTVWGVLRLSLIILLPVIGIKLNVELILATWLVPALLMVGTVTLYLFVAGNAPLRTPLGNHRFDRKTLIHHLGFEQFTALGNGLATMLLPAVVLASLDDDLAAPFLAAYMFIVVSEGAMAAFANAYAVEVRRVGQVTQSLLVLTLGFFFVYSLSAILLAQLFADDFMALFGPEYREPGGAALRILVLGLPLRAASMLSSSTNRLYGAGWRNSLQMLAYVATLFVGLALVTIDSGEILSWCLVLARLAAALVGVWTLLTYLRNKTPLPSSQPAPHAPPPATSSNPALIDTGEHDFSGWWSSMLPDRLSDDQPQTKRPNRS